MMMMTIPGVSKLSTSGNSHRGGDPRDWLAALCSTGMEHTMLSISEIVRGLYLHITGFQSSIRKTKERGRRTPARSQ